MNPKDFDGLGLDEMRRVIREEEPVRPSTRFADPERQQSRQWWPSTAQSEPPRAAVDHSWRPGLDRDEVPGKGSHAALRDGNGLAADIKQVISTTNPSSPVRPAQLTDSRNPVRRNKMAFAACVLMAAALLLGRYH